MGKYFEISSEFERQLSKFGPVTSIKFLRRSEGYTTAGTVSIVFLPLSLLIHGSLIIKVLAEYEELEGAILAKSTLKVSRLII